ncbi:MAG TPA: VOC family protein [Solirubrobacteraceae bacterium]|jgi:catechol 2,3-dioxygenase-like lactoylglutathione lyase family enzyme|nr:VOC family protein [Solirubrobacteraceae bacterium]
MSLPLWHVALSVGDLRRTHRWYADTLGLMYARGTSLMAGPLLSWTLGLHGAATSCWWLNDRQDLFQLEVFEFRRPLSRPLPADWRPCDIGYTTLSFHVDDLDATLRRAARNGSPPLADPIGAPSARRACVRDPDGVLVELMEDDPRESPPRDRPRADVPAVARSITLSVADLACSRRFFVEGLGLRDAAGLELHGPEHEALWGLAGAERDSALLWAGDFLVELVSYHRPRGAPRGPSFRASDRGLFHICFGSLNGAQYRAALQRCRTIGWRGNSPALSSGLSAAVFVVDEEGFTVELLNRHPRLRQSIAATVRTPPRRLPLRLRAPAAVRRERRFRGAMVVGADAPVGRELCRLMAEDGTSLWLLDAPGALLEELRRATGAGVRSLELAALCARLANPAGWDGGRPPELLAGLPPPASGRPGDSLMLLAQLLPAAGSVRHVTAIAPPAVPRELAVLRAQLAYMECTATLAVLSNAAPARPAGAPRRRALALTPREAAEAIYLASLRRTRAPWPRPSLWPPRRGASEAPGAGAVLLCPPPPRRRHEAPQQLPAHM